MANTPKTTTRDANGLLVQTQLQGTALNQGAATAGPLPAVTPGGAAGQGASPDQAKMAGTPGQKAPVLAAAVAQGQTLTGQQRLTQAPAAPDVAEQAAGDTLSKLGSYGSRIKALVNTRLNAIGTQPVATEALGGTLGLDYNAVNALLVGKDDATQGLIRTALDNYVKGGRTEAQLAALSNTIGPEGMAVLGGGVLPGLVKQDLGGAARNAQGAVTVKELDLAQAGINPDELAKDLGVTRAQLDAYSPDQLQTQVETATNQHFTTTDALKSEYLSASEARKQQIAGLLRARGESGASAVEAAVADLGQRMEQQEQIDLFGTGQTTNINDLLKNEDISRLITDAVADPNKNWELAQTHPGLSRWITQNKASLALLTAHMGEQVTNLQGVQADYKQATAPLTDAMKKAFGVTLEGTTTADQVAAVKDKLAKSGTFQAMQADPAIKSLVQDNPDLVKQFDSRGMSAADIKTVVADSTSLKGDPDTLAVTGLDASVPVMFLSPVEHQTVDATRKALNVLHTYGAGEAPAFRDLLAKGVITPAVLQDLTTGPGLLLNPTFASLVKDGTIDTGGEISLLTKRPDLLQALDISKQTRALTNKVLDRSTPHRDVLTALFGSADVNLPALVQGLNMNLNANTLQQFDATGDGKITMDDFGEGGLRSLAGTVQAAMPDANKILATEKAPKDIYTDLAKLVTYRANEGQARFDKWAADAKAVEDARAAEAAAAEQKRLADEAAAIQKTRDDAERNKQLKIVLDQGPQQQGPQSGPPPKTPFQQVKTILPTLTALKDKTVGPIQAIPKIAAGGVPALLPALNKTLPAPLQNIAPTTIVKQAAQPTSIVQAVQQIIPKALVPTPKADTVKAINKIKSWF